jgi:transcriptional regulator with XRE-family HTH domain/tetratricopeptide (TPR) repeat protein
METNTLIPFGELLKTYRKQQGLTQQQLARKLAVHQNTIGAWERGDYLPASRSILLETARCLHLSEDQVRHLLEAGLLPATFYWGIPYQRNSFFIGRQELLKQTHALLTGDHKVVSCCSCALSGMGGIGKTQTAIEYAYQYASDYASVFWANAESNESLLASFAAIAEILNIPALSTHGQEEITAQVLDWLTTHQDWLLILDNVVESALVQHFVPASRHGTLLLTTRLPTLDTLAPCLELSPLSMEKGTQLLLKRVSTQSQHQSSLNADETTAARTIATIMGGLPLALDYIAIHIEESQSRFVDFLPLLRQNALQMLQLYPSSALYPHSVEKTFLLTFEQLQRQAPVAADLLNICCLLAPDEIPETLLIRGALYLNEELRDVLTAPFRLHMIFKELLAHALLRRNVQNETLSVHPLVQIVLKEQMPEAVQRVWIERLILLLNALFLAEQNWKDKRYWAWYDRVLPHTLHVLRLAEQIRFISHEFGSLLYKTATYLAYKARYEQAAELYHCAISVQERALGMDHPDIALPLNGLAALYCDLERYREAETLALRALSIYEQKLEPDQHTVAAILENLARLAYQQKRYAEAEAFISHACTLHEKDFHSDLGLSLHLKANIYRAQGKYQQAASLYQQALDLYQEGSRARYIEGAILAEDLALLSLQQGRSEEAEQYYQEALRTWELYQELNHPAYAQCLQHYAEQLRRKQRTQEANFYHRRGQEVQFRYQVISQGVSPASPSPTHKKEKEREEVDPFESFLQTCCVLSSRASCRAADLWMAYQEWMQVHEPGKLLSRQAFTFQLRAKGCHPARTNITRLWYGIELKTDH